MDKPARKRWCYDWPHPALTVDVVLFAIREARLSLLLIRRGQPPFVDHWALPGGFVDIDEPLEAAANRELQEETGLSADAAYLEQLYTFGQPDRDPRERVVSVAWFALLPGLPEAPRAGDDAAEACWFDTAALPPLAFDHDEVVAMAIERLRAKLLYSDIALRFMPEHFTLGRLQAVYEAVLGRALDKRNFRRRILALGDVEPTDDFHRDGNHRPARLYRRSRDGRHAVFL